jgi:hypothetical protein
MDLLKEKLESGVRFDKYVINYGRHPNDVPSVTSCEMFGDSHRPMTNLEPDTVLKQQFKAVLRGSGSQRVFYCYLTSAAVRHRSSGFCIHCG